MFYYFLAPKQISHNLGNGFILYSSTKTVFPVVLRSKLRCIKINCSTQIIEFPQLLNSKMMIADFITRKKKAV